MLTRPSNLQREATQTCVGCRSTAREWLSEQLARFGVHPVNSGRSQWRRRVLSACLSLLAVPLSAQKALVPAKERPVGSDGTLRIFVDLVQVDAIVTDKGGKQVTDLRPADFEVLQDGRVQRITNLSYILIQSKKSPRPTTTQTASARDDKPPRSASHLRREQVQRTLALVVDDLSLAQLACKDTMGSSESMNSPRYLPQAFASFNSIRAGLKKFVEEQVQSGDLVAMLRTSGSSGMLHQFSTDRRQLLALAARFEMRTAPCLSGLARYGDDSPLSSLSHSADFDLSTRYYTVGMLNSLNYFIQAMASLPGRKSLVLLSPGFEFSRLTSGGVQALIDAAHRAAVTIYAIDPRGVQTTNLTASDNSDVGDVAALLRGRSEEVFATQATMKYLPSQTGGRFFGTNDIGANLANVLEDQRGYYLIGYSPDRSTFQGSKQACFHRIVVRVKRTGVTVRSRSGFLGVEDSQPGEAPRAVASLSSALTSPFLENDLDLTLTPLHGYAPTVGSLVRTLVHLDVGRLSFHDKPGGQKSAGIEAVAVAFGETGQPADEKKQSFDLAVGGSTLDRLLRNGMVLRVDVPIRKPGPYQLRVAVRDKESGKLGSATQFVDVPDLAKGHLTLSGILIRGLKTRNNQLTDPTGEEEDVGNIASDADVQAGPAVRRFRPGMWLNFSLHIYNAQLDKVTGKPRLESQVRLYQEGQEVYAGRVFSYVPPANSDMRSLLAGGNLQLASSIRPGRYYLHFSVKDQLAPANQQVAGGWADFEVLDNSMASQ